MDNNLGSLLHPYSAEAEVWALEKVSQRLFKTQINRQFNSACNNEITKNIAPTSYNLTLRIVWKAYNLERRTGVNLRLEV